MRDYLWEAFFWITAVLLGGMVLWLLSYVALLTILAFTEALK